MPKFKVYSNTCLHSMIIFLGRWHSSCWRSSSPS